MEKVILSFLIVFVLSFSVTGQTRNTNAGTAEWTQNSTSTNLNEASLNVNGTNHGDAYDGAFNTSVSGTNVEIIERNFTYSYTYAICILHVVVRNTGTSSSTYSISNFGNLGSDGNTYYHYSSSSTSGCYFVSSDKSSSSTEAGDPVTSFLFGNRINRGTINLSLGADGNDNYNFTLSNVTIAAGETQGYIFLAGLGNIDDSSGNTASGARVAAQNLRNRSYWPSDFYTGLTEAEKAQIMNWDFPITAPSSLSYSPSSITVTYGESIPTTTPSVNGWVSSYSISPSLQGGLAFNTSTGQISGTPTSAFSQKTYTITAQNTGGSTSTTLRLTVNKKNLNVTAENKTKQYDGNPYNNFTVTYNGFISGENQSNLSGTLSFAGNATTATNGGSSYTITPQGLSSANYAITYTNGTLSITPKTLTITAENKTKVYDGETFSAFTVSYDGFITGEDQAVLDGSLSFAGTATSTVNVGTAYVITPQGLTSDNYDITFVDGELDITLQPLIITAENKTKVYDGQVFSDFAVSYNGFISGEDQAVLGGTLSFAGTATSAVNVGTAYVISPQGLTSDNYNITFVDGELDITLHPLTISAENKTKVYDGQVFSDFTVSYDGFITGEDQAVLGGSLSFAGTATSAVNVGTAYVISPQGLTSDNYNITFVDGELDITLQPLIITAENKTKVYDGQVFSDFAVSYNGFISGEDQAVLGGSLSFAGTATSAVNVGTAYAITPQGLTSDNYDITFVDGELDITLQPLTITADDKTKVYDGQVFSDFSVSYDGFITGEDQAVLDGSLSFAGTATSAVNVGTAYVITPQGLTSDNYDITFVDGALDITLKPLTITADNKTKIYDGQAFSDFSVSYNGFITGEDQAVLDGSLSFAGTATSAVNVGTAYVITPQGLTSDNYDITFVDGALDITLKPLTITADNKTKIYDGQVFSDFTVSYDGFITGEDQAVLDGSLSFAGTATSAVNVGTAYVITPQGLTSNNYDITFVDGALDITLKPLTITADNKTKIYDGQAFSDFSVSYNGFITGEDQAVLGGSLSFAGTATSAVNVGTAYVITPQGLTSDNYNITFVDGELDITLQPLTITAENKTKVYDGQVFSDFTVSYDGFITGEDQAVLGGSLSFAGTATSAVNVGSAYVITPQGLTSDNYDITFVDGELDITLQPLTITAENKTKIYDGQVFSDFTVSYDGFITGEDQAVLDGSLSFAGTATSAVNVGTAYVITPQGLTSDNYDITFVDGELDITLQPLTITAENKTKIYDGQVFSDFTVSYDGFITGEDQTVLDGSLSFAGTATSAVNVGTTYVITPQGLTSDNYDITFVDGELDITLKPLTITAKDKTKVYDGELFSDFSVSYNGFITGEDQAVLGGSLSFAGTATSAVNVGSAYVITPQGLTSDNYDITFVDGALDITLKPLTITADNKTKIYDGQVFSDFTVSYDGFIAGEDQAVLGGSLSFAGTATSAVNVGSAYVITPQGLTSDNYDITFVDGALDITLKPLTITADNKTKIYDGQVFSDFTVSYDGFIAGEDQAVLGGSLSFAGTATSAVNVGSAYVITPQGLTSDNYDITFVDGALDITLKPLTITADNKTKIYDGQVFSDFTVSYDGFIAGENQAVLGDTLSFAGTATSAVNAGTAYVISPQGLTSENYDITFVDGELDITLQPLTITAENKTKVYDGETFSDFTISYDGFITGEDETMLDGALSFAGTATSAVNVGTAYVITPQGLTSENYDITFVDGELDINKKELSVINAIVEDKVYDGTTLATITGATLWGTIEGDDVALINYQTGTFSQSTAGTDIGVATSMSLTGEKAFNYRLIQPSGLTANITTNVLKVSGTFNVANKIYDGNSSASIETNNLTLEGFIPGDDIYIGKMEAAFSSVNAGENIQVDITDIQLYGSDSSLYLLETGSLPATYATIEKKELIVKAHSQAKMEGVDNPTLTFTYNGFIEEEDESFLTTPPVASTSVSRYSVAGFYSKSIIVSGGDDDNYTFSYIPGNFTVFSKKTDIIISNLDQAYDGLPKEVDITTEPEGISVLVTYNGKRELPVNPGLYQVIVTTDEFGYNGNASAFLKISDKTPPEVYCQPFQVYLNFGDDYSFTEADIENIAGEPQDNLTPSELLSVHITPEIVTSDYIGQQIPLTVFVADTSENTTQCTTWVNIKTNHPPQVNENIPQTLTFTVDGTGIIYLADLFSDIDEGQELIFSFLLTPYTEEKSGSTIIPEPPQTDDINLPSWIIFDKERMALLFNPEAEDSGTYVFTIVATDASGESASVEIMLEIEHAFTTGINDFNVLEHLVYPNPSSGNIFVKVTDGYFTKETEIIIRNTQGQNIYHQKNDKLSGSAQIDLSQYPDGIYFVTVMSKEKQSSHKIILSKNNMR